MIDYRGIEQRLAETLGLRRRPVAVTFRDTPPAGLARFAGSEPSGCSFWRLAADGRAFYTVPSDHYNCAIGSHTHGIPLPAERAQELEQTLSFMTGIGYIRMEEVPGIPRLSRTPGAVVYTPLGETPVDPDVVLFAGRPGRLLLDAVAHTARAHDEPLRQAVNTTWARERILGPHRPSAACAPSRPSRYPAGPGSS